MHITDLFSKTVLFSGMLMLNSIATAHDNHHMMNIPIVSSSSESHIPDVDMTNQPEQQIHSDHAQHLNEQVDQSGSIYEHMKDHGGQIVHSTVLENKWMMNDDGDGELKSRLKSWIGTDENKLFLSGHLGKAESTQEHYDISALYSRKISDFWDIQTGVRYRNDQHKVKDKQQVDAQLGILGLAPYYFETEGYLYIGDDEQISMSLEMERDILFTQKLIAMPYLDAEVIFSDHSKYAKKTGLANLQAGIQTRYEITKKVMPFIDIAYSYENGLKQTSWQAETKSASGLVYGAGITFKF
nr:copper resistance protein B [Acinetobacter sp. Marseille-Q1620]